MSDRYIVQLSKDEIQAALRALEQAGVDDPTNKLWQNMHDQRLMKAARTAHRQLRSAAVELVIVIRENSEDYE